MIVLFKRSLKTYYQRITNGITKVITSASYAKKSHTILNELVNFKKWKQVGR